MWDKLPHMSKYSRTCLSWLEKYVALTFGLQKLHKEYSKGVAKMVKVQKDKTSDGRSLGLSWTSTIGYLGDLSEKHRQLAAIFGEIGGKYQEEAEFLSSEHRTLEEKARLHQSELDISVLILEKTKDKFFQRQAEASKTEDVLFRAEEDKNMTEDDVQKLKNTADEKKAKYNKAREDYSDQLAETNRIQKEFFKDKWPTVLSGMRGIIDRSVESVVSLLRRLDHLSKGDLGDLGLVADELESSADQDFCIFLNWVKSGNALPKDFAFEETGGTGRVSAFGTLRKSFSRASVRLSTTRVGSGFNSRMSLRSPAPSRTPTMNNRCTSLREPARRNIYRKPSIIQEDYEASKDQYKSDVSNDSLEQVKEDQRHFLNQQQQQDKSHVELVIREPNDPPSPEKSGNIFSRKSANLEDSNNAKEIEPEKPKLNITVNPFEEDCDVIDDDDNGEPMESDDLKKVNGKTDSCDKNESRSSKGTSVHSYDDRLNPFTDNFEE